MKFCSKKAAFTAGYALILAVVTLLLCEVVLRVIHHFRPIYIFYDDSYNRFRGRPHADEFDFRLNSSGFKDREFTIPKNSYRIVAIGDSFAFGVVPYRHNYLTLVESAFSEEGQKVEILNMGIPWMGPKEYLSILAREGLQYKPDMVLLSFFVGNDFYESYRGERSIWSYSYLYEFMRYCFNVWTKVDGQIFNGNAVYCDDCPTFDNQAYLEMETNRSFIYLRDNPYFQFYSGHAIGYLKEISRICRDNGIDLKVVIIPDELQVNAALQTDVRKNLGVTAGEWNIRQPDEVLTRELAGIGVGCIDLLDYFAEETTRKNLYKPRDSHWNIEGNRLASHVVHEFLKQQVSNWKNRATKN